MSNSTRSRLWLGLLATVAVFTAAPWAVSLVLPEYPPQVKELVLGPDEHPVGTANELECKKEAPETAICDGVKVSQYSVDETEDPDLALRRLTRALTDSALPEGEITNDEGLRRLEDEDRIALSIQDVGKKEEQQLIVVVEGKGPAAQDALGSIEEIMKGDAQ
ncbi:hypothetical protein [Corynebacterium cystitidis]|uniref:hypothetical protein n=1 Tax=Corynebacterium cystitidis TaxID=35757 RepID=UPI00211DDAA7|nr:hypothetical protein [Corynebacterium cystitidis]